MEAPSGSGIAGLGSFVYFKSFPEDDNIKNESVRRPVKASASDRLNLAILYRFSEVFYTQRHNLNLLLLMVFSR